MARDTCGAVVSSIAFSGPSMLFSMSMVSAGGEIHYIDSRAGHGSSSGGKLSFVLIVHLYRLSQYIDAFRGWQPCVSRGSEELVITFESREVVAIGVAVSLREHVLRIGGIENTIGIFTAGLFANVI